jgi:hypothetical protein
MGKRREEKEKQEGNSTDVYCAQWWFSLISARKGNLCYAFDVSSILVLSSTVQKKEKDELKMVEGRCVASRTI